MSNQKKVQKQGKSKKIRKQIVEKRQEDNSANKINAGVNKMDKRFSKAQYDPKFMTPSSKVTKVKIDKRFSKMLKDPSFNSSSTIDRYGRAINEKSQNKELNEYYYMDGEQAQQNQEIQENQHEVIENQLENVQDSMGHEDIRQWMENYNQQSSELSEIDYEDMDEGVQNLWSDESEHVIKGENVNATKRLALCNYDWMNISAKDLMLLFNSFKTKSGFIRSIKVYMSNFGKEKLEQQQKFGPSGIWREQKEVQKQIETQSNKDKKQWRKSWKQLMEERQDNNNAFDENKLRKYEKERLKYFYAVIECDSKRTADDIYKECDGNQFQNSNLQFDLRFIPDETEFDLNNLKEECNDIPMNGQVKNFVNRALGHSKVSLTWEDPDLSFRSSLKKINWNKLSEAEIDKMDWNNYINEDQLKEDDQMKKITGGKDKQLDEVIPEWKKHSHKKYRKQDDIQITFEGGFDSKNKTFSKQKQQEFPSLNKQRKSMKERRRQNQEQKQKKREQLALLVENKNQGEFKFDANDQRFSAVYNNPLYAIDPVDHRFDHRHSGQVFAQVVKRNKNKNKE